MSLLFTSEQQALFESLLQARRDVRGNHFLCDEPVSDDEIQRILQAAIWAPSVGYSQPWRFVVIRDDQVKQQVAHSFKQENEKAAHLFDEKQQQYQQRPPQPPQRTQQQFQRVSPIPQQRTQHAYPTPPSATSSASPTLTAEQRQRMEENRRRALAIRMKKQQNS